MKQTDFVAKAIALLGALFLAAIDCALAPINASSLLAGVIQGINRLWLPFIAAWREF